MLIDFSECGRSSTRTENIRNAIPCTLVGLAVATFEHQGYQNKIVKTKLRELCALLNKVNIFIPVEFSNLECNMKLHANSLNEFVTYI